jgi:hypothetical protein
VLQVPPSPVIRQVLAMLVATVRYVLLDYGPASCY